MWRSRRGRRPILVYQMGKVASQSVARSLDVNGVFNYQLHHLSSPAMAQAEQVYGDNWDPRRGGATHLWRSQWVRRQIARHPQDRWKIITIVRDPVARNVSSFFQVADIQLGLDLSRVSPIEAADQLGHVFLHRYRDHDVPLRWLDEELRAVFDVDVYSCPFSRTQGFARYSSERADVLLLRYDDLTEVFDLAVSEFLAVPATLAVTVNTAATKSYADVYAATKHELVLPADYLNRMYDSSYARHFWDSPEIAAMRSRWEAGR